jgi:hypothetical protein
VTDSKKTAFIRIGPEANVKNLIVEENMSIGDDEFVDNQGNLSDTAIRKNTHIVPKALGTAKPPVEDSGERPAEHWYKKPIGIIGMGVATGLIVAGALFAISRYF